jgi:hypothetical protein
VQPDGETITVNGSGVISASSTATPIATPTSPGIVQPDGKSTFVNENGIISARGMQPTTILFTSTNTVFEGCLDITEQPGLIPRTAYPAVMEILGMPENDGTVWVDESVWQAEIATFGFTYKYSKGDGSTTWRPPYFNDNFLGARGAKHPAGSVSLDQLQGHSFGRKKRNGVDVAPNSLGSWLNLGAGTGSSASVLSDAQYLFNSAVIANNFYDHLGEPVTHPNPSKEFGELRVGGRTEPRAAYGKVLLVVSNMNIDASEQNIQVLVDSLVHKLDISDYQADAWKRPLAILEFNESANILWSRGIVLSLSKVSNGKYNVTFSTEMPNLRYSMLGCENSIPTANDNLIFSIANKTLTGFELRVFNFNGQYTAARGTMFVTIWGE